MKVFQFSIFFHFYLSIWSFLFFSNHCFVAILVISKNFVKLVTPFFVLNKYFIVTLEFIGQRREPPVWGAGYEPSVCQKSQELFIFFLLITLNRRVNASWLKFGENRWLYTRHNVFCQHICHQHDSTKNEILIDWIKKIENETHDQKKHGERPIIS